MPVSIALLAQKKSVVVGRDRLLLLRHTAPRSPTSHVLTDWEGGREAGPSSVVRHQMFQKSSAAAAAR